MAMSDAGAGGRGPKLEPVVLTDEERSTLEGWVRRRKSAQALALRSRIVLACARDGVPPVVGVAAELGVSPDMVRKWRRRVFAPRVGGLGGEPRPGRPPADWDP